MKRAHDASRRGLFSSAKLNTKQLFKFGTVPALYPLLSIHAPRRGATHLIGDEHFTVGISIHAPRAGSDPEMSTRIFANSVSFQSTHPVRGATANMYNLVCSYFCNFTKSDVCLLTLYLFYHAISTENVVFSRFSAVRSAPGIHVRSRFAPRQSISSPSGA